MLETLQGDLGCNRRVGGLCSCVSYHAVAEMLRLVRDELLPEDEQRSRSYHGSH